MRVLCLTFGARDLLLTRFAPSPAPLMELGLAMATLRRRDVVFDGWRLRTARRVSRPARALWQLVPVTGAGPLFLDPISDGLDDGLDLVLATPRKVVRAELDRVFPGPITPWVRALDARDEQAWATLAAAVRSAYDAVLADSWPRVVAAYQAEIAMRSRVWAADGLRTVLTGVFAGSTWHGMTLRIPTEGSRDIDLGGRGLTLLPSVLWCGRPLLGSYPDGSVLLVHRAATPLPLAGGDLTDDSLAALLGSTRAAVLLLTATPRTTTEVAREAGISVASASQHAKILRSAGLITTVRDGKSVLHGHTRLGAQLLAPGQT